MENRLFLMDKNVFSAEYLNWVCDLTALVPPPPPSAPTRPAAKVRPPPAPGAAASAKNSGAAAAAATAAPAGALGRVGGGDADERDGDAGAGGDEEGVEGDVDEVELSAVKVALFLALDTVARARDKDRLPHLMRYAREWFRASPAVCRWALEQVGHEHTAAAAARYLWIVVLPRFFSDAG